ncbi:GNAT family N-acetyltransferase [Spirosoma linguale]|uniref:GCN5-related N-acetyltransferase n=1 Tax=Spirosoma linguale (strain ATCC 33905 / DSM 74 / LMG 10896 / Claus 1) TaxID=504472 RepID=D2QMF9_SPILD|nr:GCN5-related N-acetyltransferase [Spirosoma linguale DSM 74]
MPTQSTFPSNLTIRPATQTDESAVYDFLCTLEETTLDRTSFSAIFHRNTVSPLVHYLVAEKQGEVVGFISCHVQYLLHHTGKVGEIQELFVRPEFRNQRIGQQLVATLTALAIEENFVNLEVTTNQKRADTIRFYEREAFIRTHVKLVKPIQS